MNIFTLADLESKSIPSASDYRTLLVEINKLNEKQLAYIMYGSIPGKDLTDETIIFSDVDIVFFSIGQQQDYHTLLRDIAPVIRCAHSVGIPLQYKVYFVKRIEDVSLLFRIAEGSFLQNLLFEQNQYGGLLSQVFIHELQTIHINNTTAPNDAFVYMQGKYEKILELESMVFALGEHDPGFRDTPRYKKLLESVINGFKHAPIRIAALSVRQVENNQSFLDYYQEYLGESYISLWSLYKNSLSQIGELKGRFLDAMQTGKKLKYLSHLVELERLMLNNGKYFLEMNLHILKDNQ